MRLKNYKVLNECVYLDFEDIKLKISSETFDELDLNINKECDLENIKSVQKRNEIYAKYAKKLRLKLETAYECRTELFRSKMLNSEDIKFVVDKLIKNHILDDELYAEQFLKNATKDLYGRRYIINELSKKGISKNILGNIEFDKEDEVLKAKTYFKLISNSYASKNYVKQRQKIYKVLLKHGFDTDIIKKILDEIQVSRADEIDKLKKDLAIVKSKLGIYKDLKELNNSKLINEMIKKGYSYRDILDNLNEEENGYD